MNDAQLLRHSRHILLDEIGLSGQERLAHSHALIIGAGGLGAPAALYLAAAGVGQLTLVDPDTVELSNLQRQVIHTTSALGLLKVDSAARALHALNPDVRIHTQATRLDPPDLARAVQAADVVLDCSDNFSTRDAINTACIAAQKPLVSGAAMGFTGQLALYDTRDPICPCYHCVFPAGADPHPGGCAHSGVFAALTGIIGTMQAALALQVAGGFGAPERGVLWQIEARSLQVRRTHLIRDPECVPCGTRPTR